MSDGVRCVGIYPPLCEEQIHSLENEVTDVDTRLSLKETIFVEAEDKDGFDHTLLTYEYSTAISPDEANNATKNIAQLIGLALLDFDGIDGVHINTVVRHTGEGHFLFRGECERETT